MEMKWKNGRVDLGWEIRKALKVKGMLVKDFALLLKVTPATASEMLSKAEMNTERLKQISEVMGENFFERYVGAGDETEKLQSDFEKEKEVFVKRIGELEKDNDFLKRMLEGMMGMSGKDESKK